MTDIGPGTILRCVSDKGNDEEPHLPRAFNLTVGALYTCDEIKDGSNYGTCHVCYLTCDPITLKEKSGGFWFGPWFFECVAYCVTLFRPLNDGDTSLAEQEIDINQRYPLYAPTKETV